MSVRADEMGNNIDKIYQTGDDRFIFTEAMLKRTNFKRWVM
jgi:hypothetical protein